MEEVPKDNANGSINWIVSARPLDSDNRLSHNNDIVENSLVFGQMQFDGSVQSVEPDDWLSDVLSQSFDHIIFYLHGFNNPPYKKVVKRVHNINGQLHHELEKSFVVIPIFWPTQKDRNPVNNYFQDQAWADRTAELLSETLHTMLVETNTDNVHFIAHSMGARVLMHSLSNSTNRSYSQLFLLAPDIVNEALEEDEDGYALTQVFEHVTVFHARDDFALRTSALANFFQREVSRRLGASGPECEDSLPDNVTSVDCDEMNFDFDGIKGHSYFVSQDGNPTPVAKEIATRIVASQQG